MELGFSADDVLEISIEIERRGHVFYSAAADAATDDDVQRLFRSLAQDEIKHEARFEARRNQLRRSRAGQSATESIDWLSSYVRTWSDGKVFDGEDPRDFAAGRSIDQVLRQALALEREAVAFYMHLKEYLSAD